MNLLDRVMRVVRCLAALDGGTKRMNAKRRGYKVGRPIALQRASAVEAARHEAQAAGLKNWRGDRRECECVRACVCLCVILHVRSELLFAVAVTVRCRDCFACLLLRVPVEAVGRRVGVDHRAVVHGV